MAAFTGLTAVALGCAAALTCPAGSAQAGLAAGGVTPGRSGPAITLSKTVELTDSAYDIATDSTGTAYLGWLATDADDEDDGEVLHLCVLPPNAAACKGGIQTTSPGQASGAHWLKILTPADGPVALLWYNQIPGGSEIAEATVHSGVLSRSDNVSPAPSDGKLLDAGVASNGDIWTVTTGGSGHTVMVRDQLGNPVVDAVRTPAEVAVARIAFSGATPIIAMHDVGSKSHPVRYTYLDHGVWTKVASVAGTETGDAFLGLAATGSGVRLVEVDSHGLPVIARWNGHGFARPAVLDTAADHSDGLDLVADASGRAASVSYVKRSVAVTNIADGAHGAVVSFPALGTRAGGYAQLATNPSGRAWVAWAVKSAAGAGDTLRVAPVLLPALRRTVAHTGAHGRVTLTGPASCLPVDTTSVSVHGHAKKHWKVRSHSLKLGPRKQGASLNGAALKAGKAYTLKGTVVFAKAHLRRTVVARMAFRTCPKP